MTTRSHLLPMARQGDSSDLVDVHPPKIETYDVPAMATVDPKGFVRQVDEYRIEPFGLYVARPVVGHKDLAWRRRIADDTDRSLFAALIPPGPAHVDAVHTMALSDNQGTVLAA